MIFMFTREESVCFNYEVEAPTFDAALASLDRWPRPENVFAYESDAEAGRSDCEMEVLVEHEGGDRDWIEVGSWALCEEGWDFAECDTTPVEHVRVALRALRTARSALKRADAPRTLERVRKAIKSCEGALRHAELAPIRDERRSE